MKIVSNVPGFPLEFFEFTDPSEISQWEECFASIRTDSAALNGSTVEPWLQTIKDNAERWGKDRVPLDIKSANNQAEDLLAMEGTFITPTFRDSIPKLVNASCEFTWAQKTSSWLHLYEAKNKDVQGGRGVPQKKFVAHKRNKLKSGYVTYIQMDRTRFTIRTNNELNCANWKKWIVGVWACSAEAAKTRDEGKQNHACRKLLTALRLALDTHPGSHAFPQNLRTLMHELQDKFGQEHTIFPEAVPTRS